MSTPDEMRYAILSVLDQVKPALVRRAWIVQRLDPRVAMTEAQFSELFGALLIEGEIVLGDEDGSGRSLYRRGEGRVTVEVLPAERLAALPDEVKPSDAPQAEPKPPRQTQAPELRARVLELLKAGPKRSGEIGAALGIKRPGQINYITTTLASMGLIEQAQPGKAHSGWRLVGAEASPADALPPPQPRPSRAKGEPVQRNAPGWLREPILSVLRDGPKRHRDLVALIDGASRGLVTDQLGQLAREGLIERVIACDMGSPWQLKGQRNTEPMQQPAAIEMEQAREVMQLAVEPTLEQPPLDRVGEHFYFIRKQPLATPAREQPATAEAPPATSSAPAFDEDEFATLVKVPDSARFAVFSDGELHIESAELRIVFPTPVTRALVNYLDRVCAVTTRA